MAVILVGFGPGLRPAHAQAPAKAMLQDIVMGKADAPVTIIEYASLGCPHCKHFHDETLPKIKKAYIDTGKVKLIFRDFPLGTPALAASIIARCAGPIRYYGMVDLFFREQKNWAYGPDVLAGLKHVAKQAGMSGKQVEDCLHDEALMKAVRQISSKGEKEFGVDSTPTFLINGEKVEGAEPFETFAKVIDKALKKK